MKDNPTFQLICACDQKRKFPYTVKNEGDAAPGKTVIQIDCPYPWCKERLTVEIPVALSADETVLKSLQTRKIES